MGDSKKVLLIGWDAADWKIINTLIAEGQLPVLKGLMERGVMGNIATLFPVLSPMLWTSIATGKRPYKHGIYGFTEPTPDGKAVQPMTNISRKCKAIWNILNQEGMQSNVVGWWPSHPAEPINGVMVSDYYGKVPKKPDAKWNLMRNTIHPERCFEELAACRMHPLELTPEHILPFIPEAAKIDQSSDPRLSVCMKMIAECTTIHSAATHVMEHEPWDFMAVYYDAIDHFCHGFMKYHPPQQEHVTDEEYELFKNVVSMAYIYHDLMLARLLELSGEDTTVVLMSDHGFHPDHLRPRRLPAEPAGPAHEHRDYGILLISGPGIKKDAVVHGASLLDVTPTILTMYDLPVGEDMDGHVLTDVFEQEPEAKSIPSWEEVDGEDGRHPKERGLDPAESREALEQLIALGYIDRPADDAELAIEQCTRELDYNLARSYMDAGMFGEAIPLLSDLYFKYPIEFRFGIQLANCLNAMSRFEDLQRLVDDLNARWRVAQEESRNRLRDVAELMKERRKNWMELKRLDDENEQSNPDAPKLARRSSDGRPLLFMEHETRIVRKLRAIARGNPQTLDFLAATVAMTRKDWDTALEYLEKARDSNVISPMMPVHIANVYLALDRPEDAIAEYEKALAIDEFNPKAIIGMCRAYLAMDRHADALEYGERAIELKFHFPTAHFFLAQAREHTGDREGAIRSYELAIEQNPNFAEALDGLSKIHANWDSDFDGEQAEHHRAEAKKHADACHALREALVEQAESHEPLKIPPLDVDELIEQLPLISDNDGNTKDFVSCLAQVPTPIEEAGDAAPENGPPSITLVSGLPRSGTSMMMQMLVAAGLKPYTDGERIADDSNPKGYYEADVVKQMAQKNRWVFNCDNTVMKVVSPLVPYLPQHADYRMVVMDRSIREILESQDKMLERLDKDGGNIDNDRLAEVFAQQHAFALNLAALHKIPVLRIEYAEAIGDPMGTAERLAAFLDGDFDVRAMAAAIDPTLYRQRIDAPASEQAS